MGSEVDQSKEWAKRHLQLRSKGSRHAAACVTASAELPLSPREAYALMSHPDNAVIFRGIERCTYRQVLWAAADAGRPSDGRQTVEVENESGGPLPACLARAPACAAWCCTGHGAASRLLDSQLPVSAMEAPPPTSRSNSPLTPLAPPPPPPRRLQTGTFCSSGAASRRACWCMKTPGLARSTCAWPPLAAPRRCS